MGHQYVPFTVGEWVIIGILIACMIIYGVVSELYIKFGPNTGLGNPKPVYKGPERRWQHRVKYD